MLKLRKFHEKSQLRRFSVRLGLRNILKLLDLENSRKFELKHF